MQSREKLKLIMSRQRLLLVKFLSQDLLTQPTGNLPDGATFTHIGLLSCCDHDPLTLQRSSRGVRNSQKQCRLAATLLAIGGSNDAKLTWGPTS